MPIYHLTIARGESRFILAENALIQNSHSMYFWSVNQKITEPYFVAERNCNFYPCHMSECNEGQLGFRLQKYFPAFEIKFV